MTHRQSDKMHWAGGNLLLVLASLVASHAAGASSADGNRTENATATDGGFVPVVFTKVKQIIAREGSCALIDCNVTGDPFPSVQWFNSHGDRLDTETNGETQSPPPTSASPPPTPSHHEEEQPEPEPEEEEEEEEVEEEEDTIQAAPEPSDANKTPPCQVFYESHV
ncbi:microfibrillar-associated protein 3-like [Morone saxatilis]|uniref:microfibrillar-associated protein 3-like n=1 Tax=Morone saxatilis TaxID=34816 RepID=UPI0015E22DBD|nr:microfibrillar-associated protein 3-like [Morone saxatilis]